MKILTSKGFTLVELLVVITILAIISVVAYQNFGGAVDKAVSGRKISDVATIETSLQQYKVDNNYYPAVDTSTGTNIWGYNSEEIAYPSNTLNIGEGDRNGSEIISISGGEGGGKVMGVGDWSTKQVGAKGTISQNTIGKQYLTKDLYDPELGDIRVGNEKMINYGVGRYVYAVFRKPLENDTDWGTTNRDGSYYNIAYTVKVDGGDTYVTKIVGDYDSASCFDDREKCPLTLIGSSDVTLRDNDPNSNSNIEQQNQGIPYPVSF